VEGEVAEWVAGWELWVMGMVVMVGVGGIVDLSSVYWCVVYFIKTSWPPSALSPIPGLENLAEYRHADPSAGSFSTGCSRLAFLPAPTRPASLAEIYRPVQPDDITLANNLSPPYQDRIGGYEFGVGVCDSYGDERCGTQ
jgi:hypothetical protein